MSEFPMPLPTRKDRKLALPKTLVQFGKSTNGSVALEFVIILPILLILLIGLIEFRSGFLVKQRTIVAATTMSNIVAETEDLSPQVVPRLKNVVEAILFPHVPEEIEVSIAVVTYNGVRLVIEWQETTGDDPMPPEVAEEMLAGLLFTSETAIVSEVRVKHSPLFSGLPSGLLTIESRNVTYPENGVSYAPESERIIE